MEIEDMIADHVRAHITEPAFTLWDYITACFCGATISFVITTAAIAAITYG